MMNWFWSSLLSGVFSACLIGILAFLGRTWIKARIENSVKSVYDKQLAALNSQLRQNEGQIIALQQHALGPIAAKNNLVAQRRVEAVGLVWEATLSMTKAKSAALWMSVVNYDTLAKDTAKDPRWQELFHSLDQHKDNVITTPELNKAYAARPFISPLAFALLNAYSSILQFAVLQIKVLAIGYGADSFDDASLTRIITAALPDKANVAVQGGFGRYQLLEEIETRLLTELDKQLTITQQDADNATQAATIMKAVSDANAAVTKAQG